MRNQGTLVLTEHRKPMTVRVYSVRVANLKRGISPTEVGRVEFHLLRDRYLRPTTFHVAARGKTQRVSPDRFVRLLKEATNILLSNGIPRDLRARISAMLKEFAVPAKIGVIQLCEFCLIKDKLTWMTERGYQALGREVCERCALNEVERELNRLQIPMEAAIRRIVRRLMRKTRDVDMIMQNLQPGATRPIHPELTLFNTRSALDFRKQLSLESLTLPPPVLEAIKQEKISNLLPIQVLAIQNGLLEGKNLLVLSETSSGKTLVAELAGIPKVWQTRKKMVYLSPLVALANQKRGDFEKRYGQLGIKVALRVGISRIDIGEAPLLMDDTDISGAQLVIGTYEGIDFLLRKEGRAALEEVGTIVVDEVQMLAEEERGPELDGLIARMRTLYPQAQIVALSATVGNPTQLAQELGLQLVHLEGRPVPLEEHLLVIMDDEDKRVRIVELVKREWMTRSSYGFQGQTLIFTNARRKTHQIAAKLRKAGLKAAAYHAGFSYGRRTLVENRFTAGKLQAVVATYALGAGIDFPASLVIFENLCMGNRYLTVSEFTQMTGRAGRLGKHDRGRAFLIASPGQGCAGYHDLTETTAALELLNGKVESVYPEYDEEVSAEQFLACLAVTGTLTEAEHAYSQLIGRSITSKEAISRLEKEGFITSQKGEFRITQFGKACSVSFFSLATATKVRNALAQGIAPLDLALELQSLKNVYIANNVHSILERTFGTRFSTRIFTGSILDVMDASLGGMHKRLPPWVLNLFKKWAQAFFDCDCAERPYCTCAQKKLGKYLVTLRLQGTTPRRMTNILQRDYSFFVYEGDIFDWLDGLVHVLDGISRVAQALEHPKCAKAAVEQARFIENPTNKVN